MITEKGRVVYDRKRNYFSPKDLARILDSYSVPGTGKKFGEFVWDLVDITLKRQQRSKLFVDDFWMSFWDHMVTKLTFDPEGDIEKLLMRLLTPDPSVLAEQKQLLPKTETPTEMKRRIIEERR